MYRNSATIRICLGLVSVTICVLLGAVTLSMLPDRADAIMRGRAALAETVAVSCTFAAQQGDVKGLETILKTLKARNRDIESAAVRGDDGQLRVAVGEHAAHWPTLRQGSTASEMQVALHVNNRPWGMVELRFTPVERGWNVPFAPNLSVRLACFLAAANFAGFFWYLRRVLRHLDPSRVIPDRVRATLDSLAEGLLVLDRDQRIVLANEAFALTIGKPAEELQGKCAHDLPWQANDDGQPNDYPWSRSIADGRTATDQVLRLNSEMHGQRVFRVNSAPILGDGGTNRGALASFADVTSLELRNEQLSVSLSKLKKSRDQIRQQNEQLKNLATRDPLTGCLNRRAFFELFETELGACERTNRPISYLIADIDHFKLVNDTHGHGVGDSVLRQFAHVLQAAAQKRGIVCRYGGEEFSVLLPGVAIDEAARFGEFVRQAVESTPLADLKVTASLGVAQFDLTSANQRESMEQADKALYAAKRTGRNRVVRWDRMPAEMNCEAPLPRGEKTEQTPAVRQIPFTAVSALSAALYYRDPRTAEHCRRVADVCVAASDGLLSAADQYELEVAALLHDVGKLGVPDAVLLKAGPLSEEEWKVMRTHEQIGVRILETAFAASNLAEIVRMYRTRHGDQRQPPSSPGGAQIRLAAGILALADAYDAMVTDQAYRPGKPRPAAFAELRRCAGSQFDPELVERFISALESRHAQREDESGLGAPVALQIGLQTEKLAYALEAEDTSTLLEMTSRLRTTALENNVEPVAKLTGQLEELLNEDGEWLDVVRTTSELLEACREAQQSRFAAPVP